MSTSSSMSLPRLMVPPLLALISTSLAVASAGVSPNCRSTSAMISALPFRLNLVSEPSARISIVLILAERLLAGEKGEAFNFGPAAEDELPVREVVERLGAKYRVEPDTDAGKESTL